MPSSAAVTPVMNQMQLFHVNGGSRIASWDAAGNHVTGRVSAFFDDIVMETGGTVPLHRKKCKAADNARSERSR